MEDVNNIWNADDELNDETLLNYVTKKSSHEEQHSVEQNINDSAFVSDAVDGLQQFSSTQKINTYVEQLNSDLHKKLFSPTHKNKRGIKSLSWEIIGIVIIILLCLLAFAVIRMRQ